MQFARPWTSPASPLDSRTTVSLVEQQPSTVISLKLVATAARSTRESASGSHGASVVRTASIVAMSGDSMAAPFAIPPTLNPAPSTSTCFVDCVVVIIATAARRPASWPTVEGAQQRGKADLRPADRERDSDQSRLADEDLLGRRPDPRGHELAHALRGAPSL